MKRNVLLHSSLMAAVVAAFALPAAAEDAGWSLDNYPYFTQEEKRAELAQAKAAPRPAAASVGHGFESVGGETGWQLVPHKLVLAGGRFQHSNECDHMVKAAEAQTPSGLKDAPKLLPGA